MDKPMTLAQLRAENARLSAMIEAKSAKQKVTRVASVAKVVSFLDKKTGETVSCLELTGNGKPFRFGRGHAMQIIDCYDDIVDFVGSYE